MREQMERVERTEITYDDDFEGDLISMAYYETEGAYRHGEIEVHGKITYIFTPNRKLVKYNV